jgi:hypothetical protein
MRWKRLLALPVLALAMAGFALTYDAKPAEASSIGVVCQFGQGCQGILRTGPGSVIARACGQDINGRDLCGGWGYNYCYDARGCSWVVTAPGSPNVSWLYMESVAEGYDQWATAYCTGSPSGFAAATSTTARPPAATIRPQ